MPPLASRAGELMRLIAWLLSLACGIAAADEGRTWRPWLDEPAAPSASPVAFPTGEELATLARDARWMERWVAQPPSLAWNDVVAELVVKYQHNPLRAERAYTYVHAAIHDALVQCARAGCDVAVRPIAMHAAASRMLDHLYPGETRGRLEALGHSAAAAALAASSADSAAAAWRAGRAVADMAIRRALYDGWDLPRLPEKRPAWKPGVWRSSPPLNMYDPAEPHAAQWRTWVLKSAAEIEPGPPIEYGTPAYWAEVDEVLKVHSALTADQKRIAEEWNLDAGSVTPGGVWNQHAKKLAVEKRLDAAAAARVFSALNVAMMDAFIACWHAKFKWWTERPVTVIRQHRDPHFTPHLVTPAFPSYVSGHSAASGAAAEVLAFFFPAEAENLRAMATEASLSRLYGGIHFRSDNEAGLELGRRIGARAIARLKEPPAQSAATTR